MGYFFKKGAFVFAKCLLCIFQTGVEVKENNCYILNIIHNKSYNTQRLWVWKFSTTVAIFHEYGDFSQV